MTEVVANVIVFALLAPLILTAVFSAWMIPISIFVSAWEQSRERKK
jgi:hypothetical protein